MPAVEKVVHPDNRIISNILDTMYKGQLFKAISKEIPNGCLFRFFGAGEGSLEQKEKYGCYGDNNIKIADVLTGEIKFVHRSWFTQKLIEVVKAEKKRRAKSLIQV